MNINDVLNTKLKHAYRRGTWVFEGIDRTNPDQAYFTFKSSIGDELGTKLYVRHQDLFSGILRVASSNKPLLRIV